MPFTPLHMGPGILVKALLQGSFSLMVFGWAQILMDVQPLLALMTGQGELHGFTHTYLGATGLALVAALSGKYLGEFGLRSIGEARFLPIRWVTAGGSALIGTWSHVVLDSIMHADIRPFAPFSAANALLNLLSYDALYLFCLVSGLIGVGLYFLLAPRGNIP